MSSLTDEQRKRIEANRQKALALRRKKLAEAAQQQNKGKAGFNINSNQPNNLKSNSSNLTNITPGLQSHTNNNPNTKGTSSFYSSSSIRGNSPSKQCSVLQSNASIVNKNNNYSSSPAISSTSSIANTQKQPQKQTYKTSTSNTSNVNSSQFYGNSKASGAGSSGANAKAPLKAINGAFTLISSERFEANVGYHSALLEIFKSMPSKRYDSNTRRWSFSIADHDDLVKKVAPLRPSVCIGSLPAKVIKVLEEATKLPSLDSIDVSCLEPRLLESLLPFQLEGVKFGVRRQGKVLIADDMGLGKTIQALGIAAYYRQDWPLLIVTPSSVRYSWLSSIERWLSVSSVSVLNTSQDPIIGPEVIIMSYDLLARRSKEFQKTHFGVVIMDESHMLKNFKSARYKAASPLIKRAKRVILLSGTPALSRPCELYTQIKSVEPNFYPNFQEYGVRYCAGKQQPWGWDFSGSSNLEELQVMLQACIMLRRLKTQVLQQLPGKRRQMIILDMHGVDLSSNKELQDCASQMALKSLKGSDRHSALLQFFSQSAFAKVKAVCNYLKELVEAGQKFLIFAHHKVMLESLSSACEKAKVLYIRIDGSTVGDTRQALVDEFQRREDVKVAVLSITAASTGLTLTAASLVVFAELYWNPGILVQAEDRAHRLGQKDFVSVHYLVAQGTADDYLWPMVQKKLEILGKAGLAKDDFSDSSASYQQSKHTILNYFEKISPEEMLQLEKEMSEEWETPSKKRKVE